MCVLWLCFDLIVDLFFFFDKEKMFMLIKIFVVVIFVFGFGYVVVVNEVIKVGVIIIGMFFIFVDILM